MNASVRVPPGPSRWSILWVFATARRHGLPGLHAELFRRYGEVCRYPFVGGYRYLISDPEAVHDVLVDTTKYRRGVPESAVIGQITGDTSLLMVEGDDWQRVRKLLRPYFDREHVVRYHTAFVEQTTSYSDALLQSAAESGQVVDMKAELFQLTLQNLCIALFGADVRAELPALKKGVDATSRYFADLIVSAVPIPATVPLPIPRNRRFLAALRELDATVGRIIDESRSRSDGGEQMVTKLLAAQAEHDLPEQFVRDQIITMLLAGHETTASALAWACYHLAKDPDGEIASQVQQEADAVLSSENFRPEDMAKLSYIPAMIQETLRLYPVAPIAARAVLAAHEINGYHIPKGAQLMVSYGVLHRRPDIWGDRADEFDPNRFRGGSASNYQAYLPFTVGRHRCIGEQFALTEAAIVLAILARKFVLRLAPGHPPVRPVNVATLQPSTLNLVLEPRA